MTSKYFWQTTFLFLIVFLLALNGCESSDPYADGGLPPGEALSTFELASGFKIELIASEPLVADPVDMTIDEDGRMYVVEMHGYPLDKSGVDQIKLLSDTDGDGQMDKSTVFADSLIMPTGIMRWKQGVLVTANQNVLYLEDSDGDGRADIRRKVLSGFAVSLPNRNANNPIYGLDNWIHLAHVDIAHPERYSSEFGGKGSPIVYPGHPDAPRLPRNANGHNVRFRPDSLGLAMSSAASQFGHTFDRWGHHLFVKSAKHIYQMMFPARYLQRNPGLVAPSVTQSISNHGQPAKVFPITKNPEYQMLTDIGVFTSAAGLTAYLGGLFPAQFDSVTFVADPVYNLVHADLLAGDGPSFTASRLYADREFLASTDAWFRPVNMYVGPDGALYVLDYYRQIIEHPEWMSQEVIESGDLDNGSDMGRIYRITPTDAPPASWTQGLQLGKAGGQELVAQLANANIWWRRHAQRLLVDRGGGKAVPALERMAGQDTSAVGRLHALWTLQGLGKLQPSLIRKSLQDSVPGIRENAIRLAEAHLDQAPALGEALLALQSDVSPKVRYQLLGTLGYLDTPRAGRVRRALLFADIGNKWMQLAYLSGPSSANTALLDNLLGQFKPSYGSLVRRLSAMAGLNQSADQLSTLIIRATATDSPTEGRWQAAVLEGLAEGLGTRDTIPSALQADQSRLLQAFFEHSSKSVRQGCLQVLRATGLPADADREMAMRRAADLAGNKQASSERRTEALELLALGDPAPYNSLLKNLIVPDEPPAVQEAALQALSEIPGTTTVSQYVLKQWPVLTPRVRQAALQTFLARPLNPNRVQLLLDALATGTIQPGSINHSQKIALTTLGNDSLRTQAQAQLVGNQQQGASKEYVQQVREKSADPKQGRMVFLQHCVICHQMGEEVGGVEFGPDLGTVRSWGTDAILKNIVDPNSSISDGYALWRVELKNGDVRQGIIANETSNAIMLRNQGGSETVVARQNITSVQPLEMSAMPADFQEKISPQQMADLVAFIRGTQ